MAELINETGHKYGKLTVISRAENRRTVAYWKCRCDCGNESEVKGSHLRRGSTESCGCQMGGTLPKGLAGLRSRYANYKLKARNRNLSWELDEFQFIHLTQELCYYCGSPPSNLERNHNGIFIYNGLDRIDNQKGYTLNNTVPCCSYCNLMKREMSIEEWINHMKKIFRHRGIKL